MSVETTLSPVMEGFEEYQASLVEYKKRYNVVYDMADPKQEKMARSDRLSIAKVITALDARHKELKAPLKAQVDLIDAARRRIRDDLEEVKGKLVTQIKDHEGKIAAHEAELQAKVDFLKAETFFDCTDQPSSDDIQDQYDEIDNIVVMTTELKSRAEEATEIQITTLERLRTMHVDALKREAESVELARLRQEQEEREAAETQARAEALLAERERQAAERARSEAEAEAKEKIKRAELAKEEAERKAKRDVENAARQEREKIEAEQRYKAELESKRLAEENRKKALVTHRKAIHKTIIAGFMNADFSREDAIRIVQLMSTGNIPNIAINY